jgi:hypothetical protein
MTAILLSQQPGNLAMSDFDLDLDHLDFDAAEDSVAAQLAAANSAAAEPQFGDDDDECSGGACKI